MTRSSPSLFFVYTAPLFGPEKFPTRLFLLLDVFRLDLIDQSRLFDVILTRLLNLFLTSRATTLHHVRRLSPVSVRHARALAYAQSAESVTGSFAARWARAGECSALHALSSVMRVGSHRALIVAACVRRTTPKGRYPCGSWVSPRSRRRRDARSVGWPFRFRSGGAPSAGPSCTRLA